MSETNKPNPLIKTHTDAALRVKVWRNQSRAGDPIYNVTMERSYLDSKSGEWRVGQSFGRDDLLKLQPLLAEAYQTIRHEQALDREYARTQNQMPEESQGLQTQRDEAMAQALAPLAKSTEPTAQQPHSRPVHQQEQ